MSDIIQHALELVQVMIGARGIINTARTLVEHIADLELILNWWLCYDTLHEPEQHSHSLGCAHKFGSTTNTEGVWIKSNDVDGNLTTPIQDILISSMVTPDIFTVMLMLITFDNQNPCDKVPEKVWPSGVAKQLINAIH